jgi:hypothetical protein
MCARGCGCRHRDGDRAARASRVLRSLLPCFASAGQRTAPTRVRRWRHGARGAVCPWAWTSRRRCWRQRCVTPRSGRRPQAVAAARQLPPVLPAAQAAAAAAAAAAAPPPCRGSSCACSTLQRSCAWSTASRTRSSARAWRCPWRAWQRLRGCRGCWWTCGTRPRTTSCPRCPRCSSRRGRRWTGC